MVWLSDLGLGRLSLDDALRWLPLELAKRHLIVEHEDDDPLISDYILVSFNFIETLLERPLSELQGDDGRLPTNIIHAAKLLVGRYYEQREGEQYTNIRDSSFGISALLTPFKKYKQS